MTIRILVLTAFTVVLSVWPAKAKQNEFPVVVNPAGTLFQSMGLVGIDVPQAMEFLKEGASVNILDQRGYSPFHYAVMFREWDLVKEMAKQGGRLSDAFVAAGMGEVGQMIGFIREAGDNSNMTDTFQNTPLHWAAIGGQPESVEALVQRGAKVDAKNDQGRTPLMLAVLGPKFDTVKALLDAKASVKVMDATGNTPLHHAIGGSQANIVALLLMKGADPNALNSRRQTPATMAKLSPNIDIQKLFEKPSKTPLKNEDKPGKKPKKTPSKKSKNK